MTVRVAASVSCGNASVVFADIPPVFNDRGLSGGHTTSAFSYEAAMLDRYIEDGIRWDDNASAGLGP